MSLLFGFITSLFVTMVLILPLMRIAPKLGIVDVPDQRKVHIKIIPRVGGIAMVAGVFISVLLWCANDIRLVTYLAGAAVILFFGVWDDRSDLNYKLKFFGQIVAISIPVIFGGVLITDLPFVPAGTEFPLFLTVPFTVFVLLGITNAINLSDGLDGLAGGTTLLELGLMAVLAYLAEDTNSFLILIAVGGSILGFLRYNTHPAQVFMGDSGSQFLGYSAGVMAIVVSQQSDPALSPVLPLVILGLPILDTLTVMIRRIAAGRSPFAADKKHLHHRLLELGISHHEAVFWIYVAQATLICAAYILRYESDGLVIGFYLLFCFLIIVFLHMAENRNWKISRPGALAEDRFLVRKIKWFRDRGRLANLSFLAACIILLLYVATVLIHVNVVSEDIGLLSLALIAILTVAQMLRREGDVRDWFERAIAYVTAAVLVYLTETTIAAGFTQHWLNALLVLAAIFVAMHTRYHLEGFLKLTPLDFLVILVAVVLPLSPVKTLGGINIDVSLTKLIVLFYTTELILNRVKDRGRLPGIFLYCCLAVIGCKGVLAVV
jgi:UDP-GlcNAc:undecaprenyl-phosphate GlcNAc-1-phosphate transferase